MEIGFIADKLIEDVALALMMEGLFTISPCCIVFLLLYNK